MRKRLLALFCVVVFCLSTGLALAFHQRDTVIFDRYYDWFGICKMECNKGKVTHYIYYFDLDKNGRFSGEREIWFEYELSGFGD